MTPIMCSIPKSLDVFFYESLLRRKVALFPGKGNVNLQVSRKACGCPSNKLFMKVHYHQQGINQKSLCSTANNAHMKSTEYKISNYDHLLIME